MPKTSPPVAATLREVGLSETALTYASMVELRPHVGSADDFVDQIDQRQRPEGYRLVGAFVASDHQAVAAAGFRVAHSLAWRRFLYCDDLSTRAQYRGQGYAGALVDWMVAEALRLGCNQFHLDSGVGSHRSDAHRLYLNKGLIISAHHFRRTLQ